MRTLLLVALAFTCGLASARRGSSGPEALEVGGFSIVQEVEVPVAPERAYELFTANVGEWWDHCFSNEPANLSMDPRAGGYFFETLPGGGGVIHAEFTLVDPGKRLVLRGPLGFQGFAFDLVCALDFEATETGGTLVRCTARAAGEMQEGWDKAVDGVWKHFLAERFAPYVNKKAQ